jgi:hypothetical protein
MVNIFDGTRQLIAFGNDHDFHLALTDPKDHSKTMITEVPSSQCVSACSLASVKACEASQQVLTTELGTASQTMFATLVVPPRIVELTGVGFFDSDQGRDGLAVNCIELHPVLKITVQGNQGSSSGPFHMAVATCVGEPLVLTLEEVNKMPGFK